MRGKETIMRIFTLTILSLCLLIIQPASAAVIKIATLSPDGTTWMKKMRQAAKDIAKLTDNRIKIKYYPGGVMGDDDAILRKMRINQLQGAAVTGGALSRYYKDADIYGMPFLFNSAEELTHVRSVVDKKIIDGLEKNGLYSFGLAESGFAYIMSNAPIKSVADLRKQKAWIPDTASARDAVKAFSLQPIPLPLSDVLSGLQTSLIDTIATSPIAAIALQWHTQVKYLTDMPLLYSYGTLVVSEKAIKKLKKEDFKMMQDVLFKVFEEIDQQNVKDNQAALAALRNQGINFVKPGDLELQEWKAMANRSNQDMVTAGYATKEMYDFIDDMLTQFRKK